MKGNIMDDEWDEDRIDVIGSNGNNGEHYKILEKKINMDEADNAQLQIDANENRSIKYAQEQSKKLEVQPVGHCLYCHEKFLTDSSMRWCDEFCRDSWQRQKALKR
jgi:hypothetical protein